MAKASSKKPNKSKTRRPPKHTGKITVLLVCIALELGVIAGSIWYYGFFRPQAGPAITETAAGFAREFFTADYSVITGEEAAEFMTLDQLGTVAASDRVGLWKGQELVTRVDGEVEVQILKQKIRSAAARIIFWQHEEAKDVEAKDSLVYYDLTLARRDGRWLVDKVSLADPEELKTLRISRGAVEEKQDEEEK